MKDKTKVTIVVSTFFAVVGLVIGLLVPRYCGFRREEGYFENVDFYWDDDYDRYEVYLLEENSLNTYYVSVSKTTLVYSEEDWSCFGDIVTTYNAWGKQLNKAILDFHINVYRENKA